LTTLAEIRDHASRNPIGRAACHLEGRAILYAEK
jgi:hypothetical protein